MSDRVTRAQLLVAGLALALPTAARAASSKNPLTPDDRVTINFLVQLEALQIAVYEHAATIPLSAPVAAYATQALARERAHRAALHAIEVARGFTANRPSTYSFNANDDTTFLALASRVEEAAVSGYNGAIVLLEQPADVTPVLARIAADEAMHAGAVRVLQGRDPVVRPFDAPGKRIDIEPVLSSPEP